MQSNKIIFLDMTGANCMLCLVNKKVYKDPRVQKILTHPNIVCMRGDYSYNNPEIAQFLSQYGRATIPFNMVISPLYPKGMIFSEILSASEIVSVLKKIETLEKDKMIDKSAKMP